MLGSLACLVCSRPPPCDAGSHRGSTNVLVRGSCATSCAILSFTKSLVCMWAKHARTHANAAARKCYSTQSVVGFPIHVDDEQSTQRSSQPSPHLSPVTPSPSYEFSPHSAAHTAVRTYVRTCVRACVRAHVVCMNVPWHRTATSGR